MTSQQSCTDNKSRIKALRPHSARSLQLNTQSERSSPARCKVLRTLSAPSSSRFQLNLQSESSGSSPASGSLQLELEVVPSDMGELKRRILLFLYNVKFMKSVPGPWKATDDAVLELVSRTIQGRMTIDELKKCVVEMENDVKLDIESGATIEEDRETYLQVFDYVYRDSVPCNTTAPCNAALPAPCPSSEEELGSELRSFKKKKTSLQSDGSMGEQFPLPLMNKEAFQELFSGPLSMKNVTKKAKSCGFDKDTFFTALQILKQDWENRQIFMELSIEDAKEFIRRLLD